MLDKVIEKVSAHSSHLYFAHWEIGMQSFSLAQQRSLCLHTFLKYCVLDRALFFLTFHFTFLHNVCIELPSNCIVLCNIQATACFFPFVVCVFRFCRVCHSRIFASALFSASLARSLTHALCNNVGCLDGWTND